MADPDTTRQPGRLRATLRPEEAVLLAIILLIGLTGAFWWFMAPANRLSNAVGSNRNAGRDPSYHEYVGDRACRDCHPGESALHDRSGHSHTLRPAAAGELARWLDGREFKDPELAQVNWRFALSNGQLIATRTATEKVEEYVLEYVFGSGRHASTFVSLLDRDPIHPTLLEHRLTYFAHADSLGLTPGHAGKLSGNTSHGRVMETTLVLQCFHCHSTVTSDRGSQQLDERTMIPNVSCERCHGPGKSHIEAARRGRDLDRLIMQLGPGRSSPAEQVRVCGQCHRLPDMVTSGPIHPDNPVIARYQPVGLMQSRCFTESHSTLGCLNCHEPHSRTATDHAVYEAVCLSCHHSATQSRCSVSPLSRCIDCHMPRRDVGRGIRFTDHWIRIIPR